MTLVLSYDPVTLIFAWPTPSHECLPILIAGVPSDNMGLLEVPSPSIQYWLIFVHGHSYEVFGLTSDFYHSQRSDSLWHGPSETSSKTQRLLTRPCVDLSARKTSFCRNMSKFCSDCHTDNSDCNPAKFQFSCHTLTTRINVMFPSMAMHGVHMKYIFDTSCVANNLRSAISGMPCAIALFDNYWAYS